MKRRLQILFFLFAILSQSITAQNKKHAGVGSVSEIVVPFAASIRNNFNLFYEIHQNSYESKVPSFWYKIVFSKSCTFQFTLFPLFEEDGYNFYLFKIPSNQNFCTAYAEESIQSYGTERLFKTYNDRDQSEEFRSNLVEIKPVAVNAGDAIYIEVISTKGIDRGHILDFRTSDNSFVVKVINDKVEAPKDSLLATVKYVPQKIETSDQAINMLGNVLCNIAKKNVFISSIQISGEDVKIKQFSDIAQHGKVQKDSSFIQKINAKSVSLAAEIKKDSIKIKSTAELNAIEIASTPVYYSVSTVSSSKTQKNATRLEVDNVLFSLLLEDLEVKIKSLEEAKKEQQELLRKSKSKDEREQLKLQMEEISNQRTALVIKSIDTKHKIREINKLIKDEKRKKISSGKSVFASSIDVPVTTTNKSQVKDTSAYLHKLPEELIYKVQLGVYKNPVSADLFKGLSPVYEETFTGGVRYAAGAFIRFQDAKLAKEYIKNMGLSDVFVIAYYKGQKISITDALLIEEKNKKQ